MARSLPRTPAPARALALALALLGAPATAASQEREPRVFADDVPQEARPFSVPDTRAARGAAERALEHVAAERWNEAITVLQDVLENHRGELLGATRPVVDGRPSQQPVHVGAQRWARARLAELPEQARELYRGRFEERAAAALERALERGDRAALATIPGRWPLTAAATRAWWALGDLEFESGEVDQARLAWSRALRATVGRPELPLEGVADWRAALLSLDQAMEGAHVGLRRRVELAVLSLEPESGLGERGRRAFESELRLPGPGEGATGLPGYDASTWPRPFRLPDSPFRAYSNNLYPVRAGDVLLLSNTLELFCINAFTGAQRWRSGEPPGWDRLNDTRRTEFFQGLDTRYALVAPAVGGGVAVAALQFPVSQHGNEDFDNIPILTIIPDRRLFAFDVETGRELWNHLPAAGLRWDGEEGGFVDRMSAAGSPVIAASRVVVPMYRMQGRIDYHVACFDLATGELLWATQVISGQRELNMFNRAGKEFFAPPVRIEGDRVLALTQLGTVAALDLFSGQLLWEALYEQVPLPPRRAYGPQDRPPTWENAPPVVADDVVVVAPSDSPELYGLDLESGAVLWSLRQSTIREIAAAEHDEDVDVLLGADETTVYLGGPERLVALQSPSGLRTGLPVQPRWVYPASGQDLDDSDSWARALLTRDRVVLPTTTQRIEVDRVHGHKLRRGAPWRNTSRGGNLLASDGALFTMKGRVLNGYFEWDVLLARASAEVDERPDERGPALDLAVLLSERGRTEHREGRTERARDWLSRAEDSLARFVPERPEPGDDAVRVMHEVLRAKARVLADLADLPGALRALTRARELAPGLSDLRDTLVEEIQLLRGVDEVSRERRLRELDDRCGELPLTCAVDEGGDGASRLVPLLDGEVEESHVTWRVPAGLWASLERVELLRRSDDVVAELEALHRQLERWPYEELPQGEVRELATARVGAILQTRGRGLYAPFDRRAREAVADALAHRDAAQLERVPELYPFSEAAHEASEALLRWALEDGDLGAVAETVVGELPEEWDPARADERELGLVLHLAAALDAVGNATAAGALLRSLAADHPYLGSPAPPHEGATLAELAAAAGPELPTAPREAPRFGPLIAPVAAFEGRHELLCELPAGGRPGEPRLVFAHYQRNRHWVVGYAPDDLEEPVWSVRVDVPPPTWRSRAALLGERVLVATPDRVTALSGADGEEQWRYSPHDGNVDSVFAASGIALAVIDLPGNPYRIAALDGVTGVELWSRRIEGEKYWQRPITDASHVVVLPQFNRYKALVLDLFTGTRTLEIQLPDKVQSTAKTTSWVEDGKLLVPWFLEGGHPDQNQIVAVDLETGLTVWRIGFDQAVGGGRELSSVLRHDGRTFLVLRPRPTQEPRQAEGMIAELRPAVGALQVAGAFVLEDGQRIYGVEPKRTVELDSPWVFLRSFTRGEREMSIHAVNLLYGAERWAQLLNVPAEREYNSTVPLPVVSDSTVALVVTVRTESHTWRQHTFLYLFDLDSGARRGNQVLERGLGGSDRISLVPVGDALYVNGMSALQVMR